MSKYIRTLHFEVPRLLSFRGVAECGKSTAANYLVSQYANVAKLAFANPLKIELYDRLSDNFWKFKDEEITDMLQRVGIDRLDFIPGSKGISDAMKLTSINTSKRLLRPLLQYYGTEYRRAQDDQYWVKKFIERAKALQDAGAVVVCDDARFGNERDATKSLGGIEFFIIRPDQSVMSDGIPDHASEALNDPTDPGIDYHITNRDGLESYLMRIDSAVRHVKLADACSSIGSSLVSGTLVSAVPSA